MKMALVLPYDFAYPGGVVNHVTALERCFTGIGHEVRIIAPVSKAAPISDDCFIPIGRPLAVPTNGSIARITLSIRLASRIKQVLAEEHFETTSCYFSGFLTFGNIVGKTQGKWKQTWIP